MKKQILGLLVATLFSGAAAAQTFMYIPNVAGESKQQNYVGWIDVDTFSVSIVNRVCSGVVVNKNIDISSPTFSAAAITALSFATVSIDSVKQTGKPYPERYLRLLLTNATVNSISTGSSTDGSVTEKLVFYPASITMYYRPQLNDGSLGTEVTQSLSCPRK